MLFCILGIHVLVYILYFNIQYQQKERKLKRTHQGVCLDVTLCP